MNTFTPTNQEGFSEHVSFGTVQHHLDNILPSASEIGNLWSTYLAENMSVCMLKFMVAKAKDPDIKPVLQQALDTSSRRIDSMEKLFNTIHHPIPEGFGENDVDINAPELFSETFCLEYTRIMNVYITLKYSLALSRSTRADFRKFFFESIDTSRDISERAADVLLAKGLLPKAPHIAVPDRIEKVNDKNYFGSLFDGKRPLNAMEVSHLFHNMEIKYLLSTLKLGLCQVAKSERIKNFLYKSSLMSKEQGSKLGDYLMAENLPTCASYDFHITNSKQSPFSDRLILTHSTVVTAFCMIEVGYGLTNSARKDIIATLDHILNEILVDSKDGTDLMIENGWLERVPQTSDRKELIQ